MSTPSRIRREISPKAFERAYEESLITTEEDAQESFQEQEDPLEEEPTVFKKMPPVIVDLKYPYDIKNLKEKSVMVYDDFGCSKQKVYDVSCFSSAQYVTKSVAFDVAKEYPGWEYRIYSYRAVKKTATTEIKKMKFIFKTDPKKKFVHVNVELY